MTSHYLKSATTATRFSVAFSVVVALILPVGYFAITYESLKSVMGTEAEINAELVSRLISTNPDLWRYETVRIEELLARRTRSGAAETRRIFDDKNSLIAESTHTLNSPQLTTSHEVTDGGVAVGRIEITRSIQPLMLQSGLLALLGLGFGVLLYRWLPFKAVVKASKKLQDTNDFLRKVMEGSTNSLVVLDQNGAIQMFNGRFEALTGCTRNELIGLSLCNLFSGDALTHVAADLNELLTGKIEQTSFETTLARRGGLTLHLFFGAVPLESEECISGIVVSLDDITDRVCAEEERLVLERHLQQTQKLESLGVLAGGIAHDFNNILTIILGYCYAINDDMDPQSVHAEYVQKIECAVYRASDLCQKMLSYAGRNEIQRSQVNMYVLVDEMVKMLHSGIKKNVSIVLELHDILVIIADNSQIQQIVMNLVINAAESIGDDKGTIKVSLYRVMIPEGQSEPDVTANPIPAGSYACLEVCDNGCGMDAETQRRLFEPFYTTKFAGRGLGMSATLGIIKSHAGAIQMTSTPGVGTTFKILLPLPSLSDLTENTPGIVDHPTAIGSGIILLVDDEQELLTLGRIRLEAHNFTALTACNGHEALNIFREQIGKIDLILLDLLMPEMGGIEAYRRLRELSETIPIVFCSGCSREELPAEILADRNVGFLQKPHSMDQLQNVLLEMQR